MSLPGTSTKPAPPPLAPRALLRWSIVSRIFATLRPKTILEIGCGQGAVGARLSQQATYLAVEPDPMSFEKARANIEPWGGTVINGTTDDLPEGETFDVVCAFEVLEHIENDSEMLGEWMTRVRPGGHLVLSVPAFQARFGDSDVRSGHFRRYEPEAMASLIRSKGWSDVTVTVYAWPLGYALEAVRNRMDKRWLAAAKTTIVEQTAESGRRLQPQRRALGLGIRIGTWPFAVLQRLNSRSGTGLVAVARRPE